MSSKYIITKIRNVLTGFYFLDDKLTDINCYEEDSLIGNVYIGKVDNIVKNINAAFVNIDKDTSCYLSLEDYKGEKPLKKGDELPVQVVSDKIKTKQMTVTADISLSNDYVVVSTDGIVGASNKLTNDVKRELKQSMQCIVDEFNAISLRRDISYGAIVRTKAPELTVEELSDTTKDLLSELDTLMSKVNYHKCYSCVHKAGESYMEDVFSYDKAGAKIVTDIEAVYDSLKACELSMLEIYNDNMISLADCYRLNHHLDKALSKRAYMNSGAYLVIEPTEALTVIDVNSGKSIKGSNSEENRLKINIEAAREVARQIRLRNITGIVIVDFINMKKQESDNTLLKELSAAVYFDPVKVNVVGMTGLGLVEITRQKSKKSLDMIFS